jgi:competence protein ComEC
MFPAIVLAFVGLSLSALAGTMTVDILDVGQGDSILLHTPAGKTVLIDAGTGGRDVVPMLRARGIEKIDLVIASHAHSDHIGGMDEVLEAVPVRVYVDQGMPHTTSTYQKVMRLVEAKNLAYKEGAAGVAFNLDDGIRVELLAPFSPPLRDTRSDLNSNSVVARVTHGKRCFLFTGDSEEPTERMLVQKGLEQCDVLKVAHHGSGHSSTTSFLNAVKPSLALISCGVGNRYKHPRAEALERIERAGATIYRTDQSGTIRVRSDGKNLAVDLLGEEDGTARAWDNEPFKGNGTVATVHRAKTNSVAGGPAVSARSGQLGSSDGPKTPTATATRPMPKSEGTPPQSHTSAKTKSPDGLAVRPAPVARRRTDGAGATLDLNTATITELDRLPGIGPMKAAAIVQWRTQHGPFTDVGQLDDVPGIGPATLAGLRQRVQITSPPNP